MMIVDVFQESECSCSTCQKMCRTPCIGNVDDIFNLIKAGYIERLAMTTWAAGYVQGFFPHLVQMIAPLKDEKSGYCTFFKDGLCELHDKGLKPTEGRYAHCSHKNIKPMTPNDFLMTPMMQCVTEWYVLGKKFPEFAKMFNEEKV